jgi:hypothetical protein
LLQSLLVLIAAVCVSDVHPSTISHFFAGLRASASLAIGYIPMAFSFGAPGMARSALTALFLELWWRRDDLAVQVRYRPGKGNG